MDANERRARASSEAAQWWLELQSGDMSLGQREQFVVWLRESAIHVAEMLHIAQVHNALEQFERWTRIGTEGSVEETVLDFPSDPSLDIPAKPGIQPPAGSEGGGRQKWLGALAASVLAIAVAVGVFLPILRGQIIETERGERREVALSDGSVLQVDPQTRLRVNLEEGTRKIVLEQGRALFRVAKDPNRPFTVQANDTIVRAVGTAFAVERKSQVVTVTVSEGRVAIAPAAAKSAESSGPSSDPSTTQHSALSTSSSTQPYVLSANEQLTVKGSGTAEPIRKVDTRRELAWTEGRLIFDNTLVAAALADFNRYNRVQLRVLDNALAARPVSGVFDASDPESFIAFIQTVAEVRIVRESGQDILIASEQ